VHFEPNHIYHVYNRGNNRQRVFFTPDNYLYFLRKVRKEWLEWCEIFSYCLMPNHFHFLLQAKPEGCENITINNRRSDMQHLSRAIGKTLSSYTQAINIQNKTTGTLFQKKTKAKCLTDLSIDISEFPITEYLINCFHYIHQNPAEARLVRHLSQWPYSSWPDYYGYRIGTLCNREKFVELIESQRLRLDEIDNFSFNKIILDRIW
jgi:putative transposase